MTYSLVKAVEIEGCRLDVRNGYCIISIDYGEGSNLQVLLERAA